MPVATLSGQPSGVVNYNTADIRVDGANVVAYEYKLDDGGWSVETLVGTHIILSGLSDGVHTVSVIGKNVAGTWQLQESATTASWMVNSTLALATLSGQPSGVVNYNAADITVGGEGIVAYKYKLDNGTWSAETPVSTHIILYSLGDGMHTVSVIGKNPLGNWQAEANATTASWTVDTTDPTVTLNNIPDFVKSLTLINGTSADTPLGQVDKVQVQIKNTTDSTYWDGTSWVATETWLDATGTTSWSYSTPSLIDGKSYEIQVKATDKATNGSSIASDSFTLDATNPTVTLNNIPDFVKSLPSISGTSADTPPGQVDKVQVQIRNTTDNTYWNGSFWVAIETWLDAIGTTSWGYFIPLLTSDKSYTVKANSVDKAGNESTLASDSFIFDTTNPTVTLNNIPDFVKSLPSISGTSADIPPGQVDKVQVQIKNTTDSLYWNGSSWVATEAWLDATGTTSWGYSMPSLTNGKSYIVKSKSIDKAGNESPIASDSFIFDATNPTVTLDNIPDFVKSLISISGTSADTPLGQVDMVQVQIRNTTDSLYWNGSYWVTTETWLDVTGTTSWSYTMPLLTSGKSYIVKAKAIDKATNESTIASGSFTFDTTDPTVTLNNIPDFVKSLPVISGTSADTPPGQVDKVQVQIKNATDNSYWDGSSWVAGETWLDAIGTTSWGYTMPLLTSGKSYIVKAKAIDKAGNESTLASDSFIFDTTNPMVTLGNIPDFVKLLSSINGTSADTPPGQVDKVQVQIRNTTDNTYWNGTSWVATEIWLDATGTTSWGYFIPLLLSDKSYTVKVKSVDKAGNESTIASDSFVFDITNPTVMLNNIPDSIESLTSTNGTAVDTLPGQVDEVQVQIKNSTDSTYWNGSSWVAAESWLDATGTSSWSCSMPSLSNGKSYAVKAKAADKAGNESPIASDSFTFHSHTPLPFWVWVVIGVAGVLAIGIVLIMLRHRLAKR